MPGWRGACRAFFLPFVAAGCWDVDVVVAGGAAKAIVERQGKARFALGQLKSICWMGRSFNSYDSRTL
jgi:hypothetical protein